ncbi:MAG: hypothetical protein HQL50_08715 [Magnetococcales bacterium]|nr:hypothetical protein [Magnetococcales bacterium]
MKSNGYSTRFNGPGMALLLLFGLLLSSPALASRPDVAIPEPLKPWVDWVLHEKETAFCPPAVGTRNRTLCTWPGHLALDVTETGARFRMALTLDAPLRVTLPGDAQRWPIQVSSNGSPIAVTTHNARPTVRLPKGEHLLSGSFNWRTMPEWLRIPQKVGVTSLSLRNREIPFPNLDKNGRLWLNSRKSVAAPEQDRLEITVQRKVTDEIPLMVESRITLRIAGTKRELLLDQPLQAGMIPVQLISKLPARLEENGALRIQGKPGRWQITLRQRHQGPVASLTLPERQATPSTGEWSDEEIWVFQARNRLRQVRIDEATAIDPQQTNLPKQWKRLPAYLMKPGTRMRFIEKQRGDQNPAPDRLMLARNLWLDFDGRGYSIKDQLTGTLSRSWRMEMQPPIQLGRVTVNGDDQLITQLDNSPNQGVEIRRNSLELTAESRLERVDTTLPLVGWNHDFQSVKHTLHLPPGWRLFMAEGVDRAYKSWIEQWTLLDLFLILVIALATGRVWGLPWGGLSLLTLILVHHEADELATLLLILLVVTAVLKVAPSGRLRSTVQSARRLTLLGLVLFTLPFLVQQARQGLHPQLERGNWARPSQLNAPFSQSHRAHNQAPRDQIQQDTWEEAISPAADGVFMAEEKPAAPVPQRQMMAQQELGRITAPANRAPDIQMARKGGSYTSYGSGGYGLLSRKKSKTFKAVDPNAAVQTGLGMPNWRWHSITLAINGPVRADQTLTLHLMPPWLNRTLAFLRVILLMVLVGRMLRMPGTPPLLKQFTDTSASPPSSSGEKRTKETTATTAILALCTLLLFLAPSPLHAGAAPAKASTEYGEMLPSQQLLNTLQQRLTAPPHCRSHCAEISRMRLEFHTDHLTLLLEVEAEAASAIPLPGEARHWLPEQLFLNNTQTHALQRDKKGRLWLRIPQGIHRIRATGPLPNRTTLQLPLPLKPHAVSHSGSGWSIDGIGEDGVLADTLHLTRTAPVTRSDSAQSDKEEAFGTHRPLPPFVQIERTLSLGLTWQVETIISRKSPKGDAIHLAIPLLTGESVTQSGITVKEGMAQINMGPSVRKIGWHSVLDEAPSLTLTAPDVRGWTEMWRLNVSPIWRVKLSGIPMIQAGSSGIKRPYWRPWPGESVSIEVSRPKAVPGSTLTLNRALLDVRPGTRSTESTLTLELLSSRGGQHPVILPEGADVQSVSINGSPLPMDAAETTVILPITPGSQRATVVWREARGIENRFTTPQPTLGLPGVNGHIRIQVPRDRWILFTSGPTAGPAILFWGALLVFFLIAVVLGRITWTPLRTRHWMLLGICLSSLSHFSAVIIMSWFLLMGWIARSEGRERPLLFNLRQFVAVVWTVVAFITLLTAIRQGLLGYPDMQIVGNGSSSYRLLWYDDRIGPEMPTAWVISLPMMVYRGVMLLWSLWLAYAIIGWARWGWHCYTCHGIWKKRTKRTARKADKTIRAESHGKETKKTAEETEQTRTQESDQ